MSEVRSRSRKWVQSYPWSSTGRWGSTSSGNRVLTEQQWTEDEQHAWPRLRGSGRDVGGPFSSVRTTVSFSNRPEVMTLNGRYSGESWTGAVLPNFSKSSSEILKDQEKDLILFWSNAESDRLTDTQRQFYGTTAINRTIPTNPMVDGSVSLAELLREGLPSMVGAAMLKDKLGFFRSLGGEYLNWEFGWKPIISDLKSIAKVVSESEKFLSQLQRDSGRNVRRRFVFPDSIRTSVTDQGIGTDKPTPNISGFWTSGRASETIKTKTEVWFSGCYSFHYDPGDLSEISRIATQARLLYGAKLTPDVVWELAPWSWLVDWMFNVGPVLSNLSAFSQDGLVLRYGYLMDYSKTDFVMSHRGAVTAKGQSPYGGDFSGTTRVETKSRTRATPYGFGAAIDGFTVRQWSILAALGLTKLPGSL